MLCKILADFFFRRGSSDKTCFQHQSISTNKLPRR
jgi:hypothetical protein